MKENTLYVFFDNLSYLKEAGYIDLGWSNSLNNDINTKVESCRKSNHSHRTINDSMFRNRDTEIITICDECKYFYHTDCSD